MSPLCGQKAALALLDRQELKEKTLQNQEAEQLCSRVRKKLDHMLTRDRQLIQKTNTDVWTAKRLQVSGCLFYLMQKSVKVFLQVRRGSSDPPVSPPRL